MGGVPGGIDGTGEVDALSGPQAAAYLRGEGGGIRVRNSLAVPGAGFAVRTPLAFADRCA